LPRFQKASLQQAGFSLLELIITLALIAIITGIAIPAYTSFINTTKDQVASEKLLQALVIARNEALLRGVTLTMCKSLDHVSCSGDWKNGQIIFIDSQHNATVTNKENIIYVLDSVEGVLHWQSSLHRDYLSFFPSGSTQGEDGTFWFCHAGVNVASWAIIVNQAGRARVTTDTKKYIC
jgi:type IV fimbrial biogenesis protein FimT